LSNGLPEIAFFEVTVSFFDNFMVVNHGNLVVLIGDRFSGGHNAVPGIAHSQRNFFATAVKQFGTGGPTVFRPSTGSSRAISEN
jgi:hypothetical protein